MKVVIIGASAAGHTVAVSLRQAHRDCSITLITRSAYPAYDKRRLLDYLAGGVREKDLLLVPPDFYQRNNINFMKECEVVSVAQVRKQLSYKSRTDRRETLEYDRLVVCSGARTVLPEVNGIHKEGVYILDSLADFKAFRSHLITDPVCIMGSGSNALSLASALARRQKEVKVISPDAPAQDAAVETLSTEVIELIGEGGIQAVRLREGKIIGTCLPVFMPEPKRANADFLKDVELDAAGSILVDEEMRTSAPDIYASGSVCVRSGAAAVNKSWDDVINESRILAEHLARSMGG
ncbi:MAG TPA: NAD(P)/FAD-dependent oxidoreductase [Candidatus Omnitrophota bacterium]|nr:NAD(P)/FAD-dependent oxidoreductase [Candidatus Omnitrophota bacterium]